MKGYSSGVSYRRKQRTGSKSSIMKQRRSASSTSSRYQCQPKSSVAVCDLPPNLPGLDSAKAIKLGQGAFASVWKCSRIEEPRQNVAVKFFHASNKSAMRSAMNELRILQMFFRKDGRSRDALKEPDSQCNLKSSLYEGKSVAPSPRTPESEDDEHDDYSDDFDEYEDEDEREGFTCCADSQDCNAGAINLELYTAGLSSIARLIDSVRVPSYGIGIVYEIGGATLTSQLWKMKGEFRRSERVYKVTQLPLWHDMFGAACKTDESAGGLLERDRSGGNCVPVLLKQLLKTCLEVLVLLEDSGVMHADIKPDNILVDYDQREKLFRSIKVIDFGSAVYTKRGMRAEIPASTTPEYLAPEILRARTNGLDSSSTTRTTLRPDIWALGSIFLEIAAGFPLWFPYKSRVERDGLKDFWTKGLLAVASREPNAIFRKQLAISRDVTGALRRCPGKGLSRNVQAMHLLSEMLRIDPERRVTACEALNHPFFASEYSV